MSLRVVSTKLTEEEHTKLLDFCTIHGCTPSTVIKQAVMEKISTEFANKTRIKKYKLKDVQAALVSLTYKPKVHKAENLYNEK